MYRQNSRIIQSIIGCAVLVICIQGSVLAQIVPNVQNIVQNG